jgi:dTDP-4-amino-4,6-dideoxygalactose transaminase
MVKKPASSAQVFTQTATTPLKDLDRWHQIGEEEARVVYEMTLRNELSGGTETVREFENKFRKWVGLRHAISVMNGTSALWSAMYGLKVGPGDEVICPVYTWICTISSAPMLGAKPVFCDVDPKTMLMDPNDLRKKITPRTKAIIPVHLWGWVCDLEAIMSISRETGVPILEDCSHAHGATFDGKIVGSIGHVGAWSMQGSKAVSGGECGVIATDDDEIFDRACMIGQVNRVAGLDLVGETYQKYQPLGLGVKFRAHPLGVGIANVQMDKLAKLNAGRRKYLAAVEAGLRDIPGLKPVPTTPKSERGGLYGFPTTFRANELPGVSRADLIAALQKHGVPANDPSGYPLLHRLPLFRDGFDIFGGGRGALCEGYAGYKEGDFPGAEQIYDTIVFLPMLTDPVDGAAEEVVRRIRAAVESLGG